MPLVLPAERIFVNCVGELNAATCSPVYESVLYAVFFFFQAEDGIRDSSVTGVQTCALPISDARADIFAIGVVLYEALVGRHPFRVEANVATGGRIVHDEPHSIPDAVPAGLQSVFTRMLAKDPAHRYQTCAHVLAGLRAVHAGCNPS